MGTGLKNASSQLQLAVQAQHLRSKWSFTELFPFLWNSSLPLGLSEDKGQSPLQFHKFTALVPTVSL